MPKMEGWQLQRKQNLSLKVKEILTKILIKDWYDAWEGNVYISFSGGKDSTVLLDIVREVYPDVPAVFVDTGLEFPEIRKFVKTFDNVIFLKPKMPFHKVLKEYGYPVVSKQVALKIRKIQQNHDSYVSKYYMTGYKKTGEYNKSGMLANKSKKLIDSPFIISEQCCDIMKKRPIHQYEKKTGRKPFIGMMAEESYQRRSNYLNYGCNSFERKIQQSNPLSFWLEKNIWEYFGFHDIPYCKIYDMGYKRTGCVFCLFGIHMEKGKNRFQLMKETHPKLYNYCINKLSCKDILNFINVRY